MQRGLVSRILFPVPRSSYSEDSFPSDLIWVPRQAVDSKGPAPPVEDDAIPCLLLTYPSARFLVIFFHSNGEDLGRCHGFCCYLREQFQVHVLAVEYPGYGLCPGTPTGPSVMENALVALRFVRETLQWPLESVKVFGRSIGTGPAIGLASLFTFAGVILVAPFLSVQELFRDRVGPFAGFVEEWFKNEELAPKIAAPTMIIHGKRDELIACRHGESIHELLQCRKLLVSPALMEHNTNLLTDLEFFVLPMFQFFALPDYAFQELKVPSWAYDKRRSPYLDKSALLEHPENEDSDFLKSLFDDILPDRGGAGSEDNPEGVTRPRGSAGAGLAALLGDRDPPTVTSFEPAPETREALQKLEEFAGRICAGELCSNELCVLEEKPDDGGTLRRQEEELDRLLQQRRRRAATASPVAQPPPGMPTAPRLLAQRQSPFIPSAAAESCSGWCGRPGLSTEDEVRAQRPRSPAPGVARLTRPVAMRKTGHPDVVDLDTEEGWCGLSPGGTDRARRKIGGAPSSAPPVAGPPDAPGGAATHAVHLSMLRGSHRPPAPQSSAAWSACCRALPSDPLAAGVVDEPGPWSRGGDRSHGTDVVEDPTPPLLCGLLRNRGCTRVTM